MAGKSSVVTDEKKDFNYGGRKIEYEFGGTLGVSALMIWSHLNLFYFW
jgi:hypothetical protein